MSPSSQAIAAGHICLDIIPHFSAGADLPGPGQLLNIGPADLCTGGAASNTGLALAILGVETRIICKVGDDAFGRTVLDLVRARGPALADGIIVAPKQTTSYTIVLSLQERDRSFLHCSGANDTFSASDVSADAVAATRLFHFGYPPVMARMFAERGRELVELFQSAKIQGATTSLDTTMPDPRGSAAHADWEAILRATLPHVDLFLPSIEELILLLSPREYRAMIAQGHILEQVSPALLRRLSDRLLRWGTAIVGIKLGERGMYLRTANAARLAEAGRAAPARWEEWADRELWAPVFQIERFGGTTGAGDATIAGFLTALLEGRSPEETLTFACAVGACCVEMPDALAGVRSSEETRARVAAGWPRVVLNIQDPDWRFEPTRQLWAGNHDRIWREP